MLKCNRIDNTAQQDAGLYLILMTSVGTWSVGTWNRFGFSVAMVASQTLCGVLEIPICFLVLTQVVDYESNHVHMYCRLEGVTNYERTALRICPRFLPSEKISGLFNWMGMNSTAKGGEQGPKGVPCSLPILLFFGAVLIKGPEVPLPARCLWAIGP